uniref:Uncharacterized protein n=1 Tax=Anguilla anguilla TaxID=7936 RepID=A0A0E9W3N5_ANGAN
MFCGRLAPPAAACKSLTLCQGHDGKSQAAMNTQGGVTFLSD